MNGLLQELTQACRGLRRKPGFLLAVLATLAIGIGSATSLYAFVRAALSDLAPHIEDIASVGRVDASSLALSVERAPLSLDDFQLLTGASSFESIAAYTSGGEAEAREARNATVSIEQVSAGFFTVPRAGPG